MIIVMAKDSTDEHIDGIVRRLGEMGLSGHTSGEPSGPSSASSASGSRPS